jgi:PAS domain S-box-containing protein
MNHPIIPSSGAEFEPALAFSEMDFLPTSESGEAGVTSRPDIRHFKWIRGLPRLLGAFVVVVGAFVLLGWFGDIGSLRTLLPGLASMKFNTALSFVLAGLTLLFQQPSAAGAVGWRRASLIGSGAIIAAAGLANLAEYALSRDLLIDQLFFRVSGHEAAMIFPGRMSPATAFNFFLVGTALCLLGVRRGVRAVPWLALTVGLVSFLAVIGYLYGVHSLYTIQPFSSMAAHTAVLFIVMAAALYFLCPDQSLLEMFLSDRPVGVLARYLLPTSLIMPVVFGWFRIKGQEAGWYDLSFGVALFTLSSITTFLVLVVGCMRMIERADVERRKAEQINRQFAAIVASTDDTIISKTLDGVITSWNFGAEKMFGYSAAEAVGQRIPLLIPEDRLGEEPMIIAKIKRGERVSHYETVRRRKDGSLIDVSVTISPIRNSAGKIIGASKIARDITERKVAEGKLKASLKEIGDLKAALDEHAIVAITNPQGRITYVNDKFCAISQYSREELLGQDHRIINSSHHPKEFIRELWSTITRGRVWHGEIKNKAKDGSFYWVDTTIVPFLDDAGKPRQYVAIRADITERKRAEETVRELNAELEQRVAERTAQLADANRELEAFSYSVSHDLRAPLRSVDGFSQAVLEDFGSQLPEEGQRYLRTIRLGAQKMGALIDDLLAFSRLGRQALSKHPMDMNRLVRATLEELGSPWPDRRVELRLGDLPPGRADPVLLKQVWTNLISNALKYTRKRSPAVVEIGHTTEKGATVYYVRDNGVGFDMRYADKLFGVFQRLHRMEDYEGTGVGLAIVQRVIHRHGGRVWAEAAPEQGATFYFTLENKL